MIVTVFDTETNGLPPSYNLEYENLNDWPHILQLSYIVYDIEDDKFLQFQDVIAKVNDKVSISPECTKIHGIDREMVLKKGVDLKPHIQDFLQWCEKSELIIGHNVEFDYKMISAEMMRWSQDGNKYFDEELKKFKYLKTFFCTMKSTVNLCNIKTKSKQGHTYTKYPTLSELHCKLFSRSPKNTHNALNDVLLCFRCFYKLKFNIDIVEKNQDLFTLLYHCIKL